MATLDRDGEVFVLDIGDGENRLNPDWLTSVGALLDEVDSADGPRALVTVARGKFFSNGLDLDWMSDHPDEAGAMLVGVEALLARVLTMATPTVAALQGHTYAAGAMLAIAHDYRVMRADRGFFCLPEVDISFPFRPGMSALLTTKLTAATARNAMITGRRYGGSDALEAGLVDRAVAESELTAAAIEIARPLAVKAGPTLGAIKALMYGDAHALLLS